MQQWQCHQCSRTLLDKLLLLNFQKGSNYLLALNMEGHTRQRWVNLLD